MQNLAGSALFKPQDQYGNLENLNRYLYFTEKCPLWIWKRYILLLVDVLISNNFSSMTFFAQPVFYELSVVKLYVYTTVCSDTTALSKHLRATEGQLQMFSLLTEVGWININN